MVSMNPCSVVLRLPLLTSAFTSWLTGAFDQITKTVFVPSVYVTQGVIRLDDDDDDDVDDCAHPGLFHFPFNQTINLVFNSFSFVLNSSWEDLSCMLYPSLYPLQSLWLDSD